MLRWSWKRLDSECGIQSSLHSESYQLWLVSHSNHYCEKCFLWKSILFLVSFYYWQLNPILLHKKTILKHFPSCLPHCIKQWLDNVSLPKISHSAKLQIKISLNVKREVSVSLISSSLEEAWQQLKPGHMNKDEVKVINRMMKYLRGRGQQNSIDSKEYSLCPKTGANLLKRVNGRQ